MTTSFYPLYSWVRWLPWTGSSQPWAVLWGENQKKINQKMTSIGELRSNSISAFANSTWLCLLKQSGVGRPSCSLFSLIAACGRINLQTFLWPSPWAKAAPAVPWAVPGEGPWWGLSPAWGTHSVLTAWLVWQPLYFPSVHAFFRTETEQSALTRVYPDNKCFLTQGDIN